MTKYRILRLWENPLVEVIEAMFVVVMEEVEAHGPQQAIRKAALEVGIESDEIFVAVPVSNWTEEPVSIETPAPRLRVGGVPGQTAIPVPAEETPDEEPTPETDEEQKP